MTADAGTHADLIAEAGGKASWIADLHTHASLTPSETRSVGNLLADLAAALEEADRQLADLRLREDRTAREGAKRTHWQRERAEAAEAALKVATDALDEISNLHPADAEASFIIAVGALAAIRQETGGLTGNMDRPFEDLAFGFDDDPLVPQAEDG